MEQTTHRLCFRNKLILAPMVRVSTLPMRLLALRFGADIVYSPELVDRRLMKSKRTINNDLGTIDYINNAGKLDLRIHPSEKHRLVIQLGTSQADTALHAAQTVSQDISGIDINCGCPKKFSVQGGMGASLLEDPDTLESIIRTLVMHLNVPVTCKIRLLDAKDGETSVTRTVRFMQRMERAGVAAIAVHCRYRHERPRQPAHWDVLQTLAEAVSVPVIGNGDLWTLSDFQKMKQMIHEQPSGLRNPITSFMFARGAQDNVSVFRIKNGEDVIHVWDVIRMYFATSVECGMDCSATKYVMLQMWGSVEGVGFRQRLLRCKSMQAIECLLDELEHCKGFVPIEETAKIN